MVDWSLAERVATFVAGEPPAAGPPFDAVAGPTEEGAAVVAAYTGLASAELPVGEAVERPEWIVAAQRGMRTLLDPVVDRLGGGLGPLAEPVRLAGGLLLGAEVGAVSGYLSRRILGQYEFSILDPQAPARLLYVAPNLADAASALSADPDDLVRWVALHEVTHALQFGGVPWLREHLAATAGGLVDALQVRIEPGRALKLPTGEDLRALLGALRDGDVVRLVIGDEQRGAMDAVQSLMALLEGYAEHVMDAVGADVIPSLAQLREALDRRRTEKPSPVKLLEKLLGLELKLRQYEQGKAFCDAVVQRAGIETLNRVWDGPELLPGAAELDDPQAWVDRVAA